MAVPASSLRDGDKWEQVASKVATATATGAAVGLGLAVLLFGGVRSRSACLSVCTGAGLGHGLTLAKGTFEDARAHLPAQLSQAATTEEVWDRGVVNGIKKSGVGLVAGGLLALLVPAPIRMACMTGGTGVGLGMGCSETLLALELKPAGATAAEKRERLQELKEVAAEKSELK